MPCGDLDVGGGDGASKEGGYMCIHVADSLHCTAETNATLESNYIPINKCYLQYVSARKVQNIIAYTF